MTSFKLSRSLDDTRATGCESLH